MQADWLGLRGRATLVVGAGGLGGASAVSLATQGARVLVVDRSEDRLEAVRRSAKDAGVDLETASVDVGTPAACRESVQLAAERLGGIEVFLHAVGRNLRLPVLDLDDETWAEIMRLNLSSAFWLGQAAGRVMVDKGYGRIVFLSSVSGLLAHAHHAPYAATKGGLNQLLRVMAREWAADNVTVNAVAPGYVETELTKDYLAKDGNRESLASMVPAGRLGVPAEVADAVTYLASDRAAFITGQILYVDGGRVLV